MDTVVGTRTAAAGSKANSRSAAPGNLRNHPDRTPKITIVLSPLSRARSLRLAWPGGHRAVGDARRSCPIGTAPSRLARVGLVAGSWRRPVDRVVVGGLSCTV